MRKISFCEMWGIEVYFLGLQKDFLRSYFIQLITFEALEKREIMLEIIPVQGLSTENKNFLIS